MMTRERLYSLIGQQDPIMIRIYNKGDEWEISYQIKDIGYGCSLRKDASEEDAIRIIEGLSQAS